MANEYSTEETTQELLQRLQHRLRYFRYNASIGITKEELKAQYDSFQHISETLTLHELSLLYYLRDLQVGSTYRFMRIAKKLSEASKELNEIEVSSTCLRAETERIIMCRNS